MVISIDNIRAYDWCDGKMIYKPVIINLKRAELMVHLGNGIYTGDIIVRDHKNLGGDENQLNLMEVFVNPSTFGVGMKNVFNGRIYILNNLEDYRVIGNKYENPELLNVQECSVCKSSIVDDKCLSCDDYILKL